MTIDPLGKTVSSIEIPVKEIPAHQQMRCVHGLKNGNVLVANEADAVVREVAPDGHLVWECPAGKYVHEALRLRTATP